jgi:hypothetical protein
MAWNETSRTPQRRIIRGSFPATSTDAFETDGYEHVLYTSQDSAVKLQIYTDSNNDGVADTWRDMEDETAWHIQPAADKIGMCQGPLAKTMRIAQDGGSANLGHCYIELKRVSTHDRGRG